MGDIKRCSRCIIPASLPSVILDKEGVCNYCKNFDKIFVNGEDRKQKRRKEFENIIQKVKQLNCEYDCLIPLSGGKDSIYALYLCDKVYNLKCLCVTFDNGFLSDYARMNISRALKATRADHIYYTINIKTLLELYREFLVKSGHICVPCMRGISLVSTFPLESFNIPIVISGASKRVGYLAPVPEIFQSGDHKFFKNVCEEEKCTGCNPLLSHKAKINYKNYLVAGFRLMGIKIPVLPDSIGIYDYFDANYKEIYETIHNEMGWKKNGDIIEHTDCFLHEIPFFIHTLKFPELTRFTFFHSYLIRLGQMTREEALKIENEENENPYIPEILAKFLEQINITEDEFINEAKDWKKVEKYRSKEPFYIRAYRKMENK